MGPRGNASLVHGPLYWERMGRSGAPMAFLHPNPTDHAVWLYQLARFSTWFRTIGIDLPGYGRSPGADDGMTMWDVAAAAWDAVDQTSSEPAVLVGCSVGFATALRMYHLRPNQTRALIFSGASYRRVKQSAPKRIAQYEANGLEYRREHLREVYGQAFLHSPYEQYFADMFLERNATADLDTILEMYEAVGQPDPDWLFADVQVPTLIVTGSEDGAHQNAFPLRDRIPGAELVTMAGAGHACPLERPWEWDAHAIRFLRAHGILARDVRVGA